jgi:uncharacterized protein YjdB
MNTSTRLVIVASTLFAFTACDGTYNGASTGISGQTKVATVTVNPPSPNMQVGQTLQMTAILMDKNGDTLSGRTLVWASSNDAIATVVPASGSVFAVAAGAAVITATVSGDTVKGQTLVAITTAANMVHR